MRMPTRSAVTVTPVTDAPSSAAPDSKRRRFLFTLGLGSVGAAASVSASVSTLVDATAAPTEDSPDGRYRETEHVRDYYRTAKL